MNRTWYAICSLLLLATTAYAWFPTGGTVAAAPGVRANPADVYNPVIAGEPLPDGFRQVFPVTASSPSTIPFSPTPTASAGRAKPKSSA